MNAHWAHPFPAAGIKTWMISFIFFPALWSRQTHNGICTEDGIEDPKLLKQRALLYDYRMEQGVS